ncbi:MAG: hypothetical protein V3G42_08740 [Oscillospiraceae bacterium]
MKVYTYCSYRSSRYGYQYAMFLANSVDTIRSMLASESAGRIPEEFMQWCENRSNWQLVLEKTAKNKYWLMAGQLEKSRRLERKRKLQQEKGFFDENSTDSPFYMTIGFYGTAEEIQPIAANFLIAYQKDGFQALFNQLEKTIQKTKDAEHYLIQAKQFNQLFKGLRLPSNAIRRESDEDIFKNALKVFKRVPQPFQRLSITQAKEQKITLSERKRQTLNCVRLLSEMENFSESILLLIAYEDFSIDEKVNIHIDYEYLYS